MENKEIKWITLLAFIAIIGVIYYFLNVFFPANQTGLTYTYLKAKYTLEATIIFLGVGIVIMIWRILKK